MEDLAAPASVIDRDGRFRWVNQAFVELFGDLRGRPFVDNVAPEHKQVSRTNFARKMVGKTTTIFDLTVLDRAGERLTLRISSAPLREARRGRRRPRDRDADGADGDRERARCSTT